MSTGPRARARSILLSALAFLCGWSLMVLEIVGARLVGPVFGTDIFAWGSVIGTFLLALSVGYFGGGKLSTRFPRALPLVLLISCCAVWFALLPKVHAPINDWIFGWAVGEEPGGERWGCLASALILFLTPSILLGTVSPYALRLVATDVGSVGEKAGVLYAISTIGSFLGCMMTSFYFLLWWGLSLILYMHGVLLLAAAWGFFGAWQVLARPQTDDPAPE